VKNFLYYGVLRKILSFITSIVVVLCGGIPAVPDGMTQDSYEGLKDVYKDYFDIGTCISYSYCDNPELSEFIVKNFSSITPEWELKMENLHPSENEWNWERMDKIADFCREHGLKMRGHTLVWQQQPNWMLYDENGNFVDKEVFYKRQYDYFKEVMNRYKDVIRVWDVTNEALGYDLADGEFKQGEIYKLCGEEYIERAFLAAHEIDPEATLVLNENGLAKNLVKQGYLAKWLKIWLDKGIPIDAVGIQGHSNTVSIDETPERLEAVINIIENAGIKNIQITEIDMSLYFDKQDKSFGIQDWTKDYQVLKYKHLFRMLRRHSDVITSVSFWGPDDGHSCLTVNGEEEDGPMIFDRSLLPKASYFAICDFKR